MLHRIFQRHGIPPHEVHALPWDDQVLIYASEEVAYEEELEEQKKNK